MGNLGRCAPDGSAAGKPCASLVRWASIARCPGAGPWMDKHVVRSHVAFVALRQAALQRPAAQQQAGCTHFPPCASWPAAQTLPGSAAGWRRRPRRGGRALPAATGWQRAARRGCMGVCKGRDARVSDGRRGDARVVWRKVKEALKGSFEQLCPEPQIVRGPALCPRDRAYHCAAPTHPRPSLIPPTHLSAYTLFTIAAEDTAIVQ